MLQCVVAQQLVDVTRESLTEVPSSIPNWIPKFKSSVPGSNNTPNRVTYIFTQSIVFPKPYAQSYIYVQCLCFSGKRLFELPDKLLSSWGLTEDKILSWANLWWTQGNKEATNYIPKFVLYPSKSRFSIYEDLHA